MATSDDDKPLVSHPPAASVRQSGRDGSPVPVALSPSASAGILPAVPGAAASDLVARGSPVAPSGDAAGVSSAHVSRYTRCETFIEAMRAWIDDLSRDAGALYPAPQWTSWLQMARVVAASYEDEFAGSPDAMMEGGMVRFSLE